MSNAPISRSISLRESEWAILDSNRKAFGMSRTEYIRSLLNQDNDGVDGFDSSLNEKISRMENELNSMKDILEHKAERARERNDKKDIHAKVREDMHPVDRLKMDIENGVVTEYTPERLMAEYGLESTHAVRNVWRNATGCYPG